jgi:hypothetical protein
VPVVVAGLLSDVFGVTPVMALVAALVGVAALANIREPRWLSPAPARAA